MVRRSSPYTHHRKKSVVTDELRERIVTIFLLGTSERDILRILRQDGFTIEPRRLQKNTFGGGCSPTPFNAMDE